MCSIEEAWAGQKFENKHVVSQGDIHNSYISLPDNVFNKNNEFTVTNSNEPQPRSLSRGVNSKYSREPRIPKLSQTSPNVDTTISSIMPKSNNYGGIEPLPVFMNIYNKQPQTSQPQLTHQPYSTQQPQQPYSTQPYSTQHQSTQPPAQPQSTQIPEPVSTGDNFTNINTAFNVSDTVDDFMNIGINMNTSKDNFENDLINENTSAEDMIINNKFKNMIKRKGKGKGKRKTLFTNINSKNDISSIMYNNNNDANDNNDNYNSDSDNDNDDDDDSNNTKNAINFEIEFKEILIDIINKLNKIENDLHNNNKRNMYDIILYIILGMLLSFIIYSIFLNLKN